MRIAVSSAHEQCVELDGSAGESLRNCNEIMIFWISLVVSIIVVGYTPGKQSIM